MFANRNAFLVLESKTWPLNLYSQKDALGKKNTRRVADWRVVRDEERRTLRGGGCVSGLGARKNAPC